ncbi:MAG: nucleotidyltransferase domain-containing protein [Mogibacterium sp.]|nr:nucleotidyltransferase domain-containing protein [Mogibacterium sp.]
MTFEPFDITAQIKNKLAQIEFTENAQVIMAVESGSRAWGFASPDSDYDVRFIYVRRPEDYIRLNPLRDVIEWQLDDVYDVSGWDLQKALRLTYDSNPSIHEWCASPIIYKENRLAEPLRKLAAECFIPKKSLYHYLSMAHHNYRTYLVDDKVRIKKYFYALRPVLAARWVADNGTAPPMLFDDLVRVELRPDLLPVVEELVRVKKQTSELGIGPKIPELDAYIREQMDLMQTAADRAENRKNDWNRLEEFFREAVL